MFLDTVDALANTAAAKAAFLKRSPGGFFVSSMMAGAFIGLGIILIFSLGSDVDPAYRSIVMGATFGIALTLVIFAGADLFTGHTMFMTHGVLRKKASMGDLAACWSMSWIGNLAGCIVLALVFVWGGGGAMLHSKSQWLMSGRDRQEERVGAVAGRARDALQLARLPRDLDVGAHDQRRGEMHRSSGGASSPSSAAATSIRSPT